jgi:hypothetical protein
MTTHKKQQLRAWVENWKKTGPELERMRYEEIRNADTRQAIEDLDGAFKSALLHFPPVPHSGLVEQQRLFRRLRP